MALTIDADGNNGYHPVDGSVVVTLLRALKGEKTSKQDGNAIGKFFARMTIR